MLEESWTKGRRPARWAERGEESRFSCCVPATHLDDTTTLTTLTTLTTTIMTSRTSRASQMTPLTTRHTLEQLGSKYREMLEMRLVHASGDEDEDEARRRMVGLASRFPGALREIDDLEIDIIRDRISRLDATLGGEAEVEPWMVAVGLFHSLARGALRAKRWLAGRKSVDDAAAREFASFMQLAGPEDALAWTEHLANIASPPGGRIMNLVFERIATSLGTTPQEARRLVFGPPRRGRRETPGSKTPSSKSSKGTTKA
jgi:hypothetical protein